MTDALQRCPQVKDAFVLDRPDRSGNPTLVAFVVAAQGQECCEEALRDSLKARLPEPMIPAVFATVEALPLTPNGKVDRAALVNMDLATSQKEDVYHAPRNAAELALARLWAKVLGLERVGIHDNFFELGGDSILSLQLAARAGQEGLFFQSNQLFEYQTIAQLVAHSKTTTKVDIDQGPVTGAVPLTPIQYWYFQGESPEPHHYNQALLLETPPLDRAMVEQTLSALLAHHDALRLRFQRESQGWVQAHGDYDQIPLSWQDLSALNEQERLARLASETEALQTSFNLAEGPLLRVGVFHWQVKQGEEDSGFRLFWAIHHLIVDGVSWRILLTDFHNVYEQLQQDQPLWLPQKTTSFKTWSQRLAEYARSNAVEKDRSYWIGESGIADAPAGNGVELTQDPIGETAPTGDGDVEENNPFGLTKDAASITWTLAEPQTQSLLRDVPQAYNTRIDEVLLTALVETLANAGGGAGLLLELEGHGRASLFDDVDLSRTLGWFTSLYPVLLKLPQGDKVGEHLKTVKEQLRNIPNQGIGFGVLRYLGDAETRAQLAAFPKPRVLFNYLGQSDRALGESTDLRAGKEATGPSVSSFEPRRHPLEITAIVAGAKLHLTWTFSQSRHRETRIKELAKAYGEHLNALINHCLNPDSGGWTPSDFLLAAIDQAALDRLLADRKKAEVVDLYPLTPMQQGMLYHGLSESHDQAYFNQVSCRIRGDLNRVVFQNAWQKVVERHSVLRTSFHWEDLDQPLQWVHPQATLPWTYEDWRHKSQESWEGDLQRLLEADRQQGFDFARPPLMRCFLIQLTDDICQFIWDHHHLIGDGWAMAVVLREVFAIYHSLKENMDPSLDEPAPFRNYIAWLQEQDLGAAETFWRQNLAGFKLPTPVGGQTGSRPGSQIAYGHTHVKFSKTLTNDLRNFARDHRLTINTLVQAGWALLLSRYAGAEDVVFGSTLNGRPASLDGIETMVGLFINTLPLRVKVEEQTPLLTWLQRVQDCHAALDGYAYTPLAEIQRWSDIPQGVALFDSIVVLENYPVDDSLQKGEGEVTEVRSFEITNYPLTLEVGVGREISLHLISTKRAVFKLRPWLGC